MEKTESSDRKNPDRVYTVVLEGMRFIGFHGCLEEEKRNGNVFIVDFRGRYLGRAGATDSLSDAVNYGRIYDIIALQMKTRSNLLENLAQRISDAVSAEFPTLFETSVCVSKKNPPVHGPCEWSKVVVEWKREC